MTVPKIKRSTGANGSPRESQQPDHGGILPFSVTFDREPAEQVEMMFETTNLIVQAGRQPLSWLTKVLIYIVLFLATLFLIQWMDRAGLNIWDYGGVIAGFGAAFVVLSLWGIAYQRRTRREFESRLREAVTCQVEIDDEGVRSSGAAALLTSKWQDVNDIIVSADCLMLIDEVWVHYVPARALPPGLTLSTLETACKKQKMQAESDQS